MRRDHLGDVETVQTLQRSARIIFVQPGVVNPRRRNQEFTMLSGPFLEFALVGSALVVAAVSVRIICRPAETRAGMFATRSIKNAAQDIRRAMLPRHS
jgi:hypothetical protein